MSFNDVKYIFINKIKSNGEIAKSSKRKIRRRLGMNEWKWRKYCQNGGRRRYLVALAIWALKWASTDRQLLRSRSCSSSEAKLRRNGWRRTAWSDRNRASSLGAASSYSLTVFLTSKVLGYERIVAITPADDGKLRNHAPSRECSRALEPVLRSIWTIGYKSA